ncbi:hypothetical protein scyTo_0020498, partial [Scyliorhinus torazame]|nr:hypothetical protein [Scyliorhinus torazame]
MELIWLVLLVLVLYFGLFHRGSGGWTKPEVREKGTADGSLRYGFTDIPAMRLSGLSLNVTAHLSNTIFGQLILVPLIMSVTEERPGFNFKSISDFLEGYKSGKITPTQVAKNIISALEDADQAVMPLRAIVQYEGDQIIKMAEASTARYRANAPLSPLDGIPVCLKEEIKV